MKISGETPLTKTPHEGIRKDEKGKPLETAKNISAATSLPEDVISLAGVSVAGTETVSRKDALGSLSSLISDLKQNPQSADILHQPLDPEKVAKLLEA